MVKIKFEKIHRIETIRFYMYLKISMPYFSLLGLLKNFGLPWKHT
jgi:hypothetical protein